MAKKVYKTPEYTRRAIDKYAKETERMQLTFKKGEKDMLKSVGLEPKEIMRIIREEYNKRISEQEG